MWLGIQTGDRPMLIFGFCERLEILSPSECPLVSEDGLCSIGVIKLHSTTSFQEKSKDFTYSHFKFIKDDS
jgi:hypothetical protein